MTPFTLAAKWHETHCPHSAFREIVEAHCQTGRVIASPELFILARQIHIDWEDSKILDPWESCPDGDTWHIWLFAGSLKAIPSIIPYHLPYVTFHRGERLAVHHMSQLMRFLARQ